MVPRGHDELLRLALSLVTRPPSPRKTTGELLASYSIELIMVIIFNFSCNYFLWVASTHEIFLLMNISQTMVILYY